MFRKDSVLLGIVMGAVIPFVGYAIFLTIYEHLEAASIIEPSDFTSSFRGRTVSLLAICLNLIPIIIWKGPYRYNTMRGIVFPTFAYVMYWIYYFKDSLFASNII